MEKVIKENSGANRAFDSVLSSRSRGGSMIAAGGGQKVLAITNENPEYPAQNINFIEEDDAKISTLKENYYKWLARLVMVFAIVSLAVFMSCSLVIFRLAPRVSVEPLLILKQSETGELIRYEPIEYNMASHRMFMELFVKQYVILRNTFVHDEREMQIRWFPGGMVNFLSSSKVFEDFVGKKIEDKVRNGLERGITTEVEIISVGKQGGENSPVWKIDFKTYELNMENKDAETGEVKIRTKYWTASLTSYFIRGRELWSARLLNPLGFTVVKYSQTQVEVL